MGKQPVRLLLLLCLVAVALFAFAGVALAQEGAPAGTVVGEGFNGPMGLLVDPNGDVWVIDSGLGGEDVVTVNNPEAGLVSATVGSTARIARINMADGSITDVATVMSYGSPEMGGSGGARLALLNGVLYASASDWLSEPTIDPPAGVATIVTVNEDGTTTQFFDSWAHERDVNPYGVVYHAHPYGMIAGSDGRLWVADAGANALMAIDPATGEATVVAVMEPLPGVFPRPDYDNQLLTDPVPTAVVETADGLFVSLLSGAPFVPGSAKVLQVGADGSISDYAMGLTMLTDLRQGPDGSLYATSFGLWGETGPAPGTGSVVRIGAGDTSEVVIPGLTFPSSLDFDADGNLYVTVNAVGAPGSGQVLKFEGVADMAGTPVMEVLAAMAPPPADDSAAMTDTATMTDTAAMTETAEMSDMAAMTETAEMSDMAAMTETAEMSDMAAMTETAEMADMAAMTETAEAMTSSDATAEPQTLPVTGAQPSPLPSLLAAVGVLMLLALAAVFGRRARSKG